MDLDAFISAGLDSKLKCFVCQNYLSYFPISLCSNNRSVCGRCDVPEATIAFQDEAFENLCQFIKFPCRYESEGCFEELIPKDIPEHEGNCSFRTVPCVITRANECQWKGPLSSLTNHCREEHSDVILESGEFTINLSVSGESDSLLDHNDILYIFTSKFDKDSTTLSCATYTKYETNTKEIQVRVTVKKDKKTLSLDFETTTFEDREFSELDLHYVTSKNEDENVVFGKVELKASEVVENELDESKNSALLSMLKCSVCDRLVLQTIYRFSDSMKMVCSSLSCRGPLTTIRDPYLQKIAKWVTYPCKYQNSGCTFTGSNYAIAYHETNHCQYCDNDCPLPELGLCTWRGLKKDVSCHVLDNHQDLIISSRDILELPLPKKDQKITVKFVKFSGLLFRLAFTYSDSRCLWSLQNIDYCEKRFKFQIEILDHHNSGETEQKLLMTQYCSNLTKMNDAFKSNCCFFEKDQVRIFKRGRLNATTYLLTFRASILK